jgi:hypothetical protein
MVSLSLLTIVAEVYLQLKGEATTKYGAQHLPVAAEKSTV